jgi:hypothetical protein
MERFILDLLELRMGESDQDWRAALHPNPSKTSLL